MKTPAVLLVTFNRPDYTKIVIESLQNCGISRLYVFNDGPREGNKTDSEASAQIKKLIESIDWIEQVKTWFSDSNLGCGRGVSSAISWAFGEEDRLIILEDDCVASPAFFPYCAELLERYQSDNRVWLISGENHVFPVSAFEDSDYIFSQFGFNCGWATWKRCWDAFDISMGTLPLFLKSNLLGSVFSDKRIARTYVKKYKRIVANSAKPRYWTAQFGYQILSNRGYCIIPRENLISNIGEVGDHTAAAHAYNFVPSSATFRIEKHPQFVLPQPQVEWHHYKHRIKGQIEGRAFHQKVLRKLIKLARSIMGGAN